MNDTARRELIGRTLGGRFRLTAFLGEGAMASVYRGEQDAEPRQVAVKIMHAELLQDATFAKRFTREAKAAARIEHRNSVQIVEHGADGPMLYLAMELLAGQDLFDLLARERRLPEARAVRIVLQVCGALAAAHAQGIVHRDLKPENVMILPDPAEPGADLVKVLDFGIAKILELGARDPGDEEPHSGPVESAPPSSVLTRVGTLVGTPEYMSPEQSMGQPVDARSDLYSCGVLLFHIVTGRPPFTGRAPIDVMMQQVDKAPPAPSSLVPGLDAGLERVILKALSKAREARHQTADELAGELRAVLVGGLVGALVGRDGSNPQTPRPPSDALRGVPSSVRIEAIVPVARPSQPASNPAPMGPQATLEAPPETLRSPATTPEPPKSAVPAVMVREAETAPSMPVVVPAPVVVRTAPVAASVEPAEVIMAAALPVAGPTPALAPAVVAPGRDPWVTRVWVVAIAAAILAGLIGLARYLRLG